MEVAMTEKALNSLLALEITQETMQKIQQHPSYNQMLRLCELMTQIEEERVMEMLEVAPLGKLKDLRVIAVCHKMREPIIIIDKAIQANLKAQQWAMDAQQWAQGLKNLRQSMESRLNQTRQS